MELVPAAPTSAPGLAAHLRRDWPHIDARDGPWTTSLARRTARRRRSGGHRTLGFRRYTGAAEGVARASATPPSASATLPAADGAAHAISASMPTER
jgi:hypothetical protein